MLYVNPSTGNDSANGSQATPFKTISQALRQAKAGDTIQLAAGTYTATTGEGFPLVIPSGVVVLGNEAAKGQGILVQGSGQYISPSFARQNVTFRPENNSQLRGVTVTNDASRGTGVWIESTNPTIANNTFTKCKREGVFATGTAMPIVQDNVAIENDANGFSITRNAKGEWRRNICQNTGFGFAISDSSAPLLADNRMSDNRSGIVVGQEARPVLRNNVIERSQEGLVVIDRGFPDLGSEQEPAGNIFQNNTDYDVNNATANVLISSGNQINPAKVNGPIRFVGSNVPTPTPTSTPNPTPTPTPTPTPNPGDLTDIRGHWAEAFIRGLVSRKIISGFQDGTFKPDAPLTRAQYAAVVANAFDLPATQPVPSFSDVPAGFWALPYIRKASQMGFISGFPDGTFRPDQNLTRVQTVVSLVSGLAFTGGTLDALSIFIDRAQIPSYATDRYATATQRRLLVNYPNVQRLEPMRDSSRAEVAAMVYQALVALNRAPAITSPYIVNPNLPPVPLFTDVQGHWAANFINGLAIQNLVSGLEDGSFRPDQPMNRAEYAAILCKAFNPAPRRNPMNFVDVPDGFWAKNVIIQAYRGGFVSGFEDGTFRPTQNLTRLQTLVSVTSGLSLTGGNVSVLSVFDDRAAIPPYAEVSIATAVQRKLVVNYPNIRQLNPNRNATRAEVVAVIYQGLVQAGRLTAITSPYIVSV